MLLFRAPPRALILISCIFTFSPNDATGQSPPPSPPPLQWRQAVPGYEFTFPRDHGPHDDFRIEWWYYTGNLQTDAGRGFGYQLTFFRTGISRDESNASRWAVRHLYLAHFAISDFRNGSFRFFERINRRGIGWAGVSAQPNRVWNEDWESRLRGETHLLKANEGEHGIELELAPQKPAVIHGQGGISQKGARAGNASHYYSLTRLLTRGTLTVEGESFKVNGTSWMDHEFGTSFLGEGDVGWDWFSLQLKDGRELMLFQIRRPGGAISPYSSGTLIDREGRARHIRSADFRLTPGATWKSPATAASYPTEWTIDIPDLRIGLRAEARFPEQELQTFESTGVPYWEGAIQAIGTEGPSKIEAVGYLEMTGYAGKSMGEVFK